MKPQYREVDIDALSRAHDEAFEASRPLAVVPTSAPAVAEPSREPALVAAMARALEVVHKTQEVAVKVKTVRDVNALRAVARSYQMSAETQRRAAEVEIICLRSLGVALNEQYPNLSHNERGEQIGLSRNQCCSASVLATYSESDLDAVFVTFETTDKTVGVQGVIAELRMRDPEFRAARQREIEERRQRMAEKDRLWKLDPEYEAVTAACAEFHYTPRDMAREIVRLRGGGESVVLRLTDAFTTKELKVMAERVQILIECAKDGALDAPYAVNGKTFYPDPFPSHEEQFFTTLRDALKSRAAARAEQAR